MLSAGAASALTQMSNPYPDSDFTPVAIEILCLPQSGFGGCGNLPDVDDPAVGDPFDFTAGYRGRTDDIDFFIETPGSIFILGPVRASNSIQLKATDSIRVQGSSVLVAESIHIETDGPITMRPRSDLDIDLGTGIEIGGGIGFEIEFPSIIDSRIICACISTVQLGAGGVSLTAEAVTLNDGGLNSLVSRITGTGDIYLDLSMVSLKNLKVKVGKSIVLSDLESISAVPEPGTALLLGLGLATLGFRRDRERII